MALEQVEEHRRALTPRAVDNVITNPSDASNLSDAAWLEATVVPGRGRAVLVLRGEIDPMTAERFAAGIDAAFVEAPKVVIDLRAVTFMDSTGVRVLIQAFHRAGQNRDALTLRAPNAPVRRVLAVTTLDQVFVIDDDDTPASPDAP